MEIWKIIIAAVLGSSVLGNIIQWLQKKGTVFVNGTAVKMNFTSQWEINYIKNFNINLQLINTSGNQRILKDLKAVYYDGTGYIPLHFQNFNIDPAGVISAKDVKCLEFNSLPFLVESEKVPWEKINSNAAFIEISFNLKGRNRKLFIYGNDFERVDDYFHHGTPDTY